MSSPASATYSSALHSAYNTTPSKNEMIKSDHSIDESILLRSLQLPSFFTKPNKTIMLILVLLWFFTTTGGLVYSLGVYMFANHSHKYYHAHD